METLLFDTRGDFEVSVFEISRVDCIALLALMFVV